MGRIRKAMKVLAGLLLLVFIGVLAYSLPQHRVVHIDGYEVKRVDGAAPSTGGSPVPAVRSTDVYFIHASNTEKTEVFVYRNEDTRFGFPWYLKFDSAEVQGRAQLLGQKEEQLALVTYYGWRMPILKLFPNAVDIEAWDSTEEPFPVFNTVFLTVLVLFAGIVFWKVRKLRKLQQK